MSSVYFPAQFVVLFRRVVDVISALSISNQYLFLTRKSVRVEEGQQTQATATQKTRKCDSFLWAVFEWPPWSALRHRLAVFEGATIPPGRPSDTFQDAASFKLTSDITFPWFGQNWSWPSINAVYTKSTPLKDADSAQDDQAVPSSEDNPHLGHTNPHPSPEQHQESSDTIHRLLQNPALYRPLRTPRYPIVLCHGLYGFDVRGPATFPILRMRYWSSILNILKDKVGAEVIVTSVPGTGSIASRSEILHRQLQDKANGREINFLAHSMGGLDCRHLISHIKPEKYAPLSLTTISTPHRGSPFMDWCADNIGIGKLRDKEKVSTDARPKAASLPSSPPSPSPSSRHSAPLTSGKLDSQLLLSLTSFPSSFTTLLLSIVDSPAYANLTTSYLTRIFNPLTPDDPRVRYFSVAARVASVSVWHPLWLPKMVLDGVEGRVRRQLKEGRELEDGMYVNGDGRCGDGKEDGKPLWAREHEWGNDGLVTVQSARWGEFLGTLEGCDHWAVRGSRGIELGTDSKAVSDGGGGNGTEGWALRDWARLVGAWKKEERRAAVAASDHGDSGSAMSKQTTRREQERMDEALIKSSTDKLSAVFDWLVEQVPLPRRVKEGKGNADGELGGTDGKETKKKDLDTKMDLERFYVALSRKLYDEGL